MRDAIGFIRQLQADKRFSRLIIAGYSEGSLVGMLAARQTDASTYLSLSGSGRNMADVLEEQNRAVVPDSFLGPVNAVPDALRAGYRFVKQPRTLVRGN